MTETLRRGYPGMKSVKDMPVLQDGPPPGGFPAVRYARRIPSTGPAGATIFGVAALVIAYGFYKVGQGNAARRALKDEKLDARIAVLPFLQAEEDATYVQKLRQFHNFEAHVMKDVPGWKVGDTVYQGKRWMAPARPVGIWDHP